MQHRDKTILLKVNDELSIALKMLSTCDFEEFSKNEILKRAICMTVINIGELIKNLSEDIRKEYPQIPWKSIAGFRDIAAHKYQKLKMKDVYITVKEDFPVLKRNIEDILKKTEL